MDMSRLPFDDLTWIGLLVAGAFTLNLVVWSIASAISVLARSDGGTRRS